MRLPTLVQLLPLLCQPRVPPVHLCAAPRPAGASSLPISPLLPSIVAALDAAGSNLVLQAPPGAGKTTTVPLALLENDAYRSILVLEPRRIAARSAASRMASLLGEKLGERIGYRVRLEGASGPLTRVLVVTEGILVRRLQRDPELKGVDVVVFDEFHERSVDADLCLALCRRAQLRAQARGAAGPKLLVMSATLGDTTALQALLGGCEAITSEGRCFPVTIKRVAGSPPLAMAANGRTDEIGRAVAAAVATALSESAGDVLAFLPGEGEIRAAERALNEMLPAARLAGLAIKPLYGALDPEAQQEAILPDREGKRRVILATPIAESSLTIEGVRAVVDSGLRKISAFDAATGMSALRTVPISLASATQRAGRAGRVATGSCYRLWSAADEFRMAQQTPPEMEKADLAPLALELASAGLATPAEVNALPWLTQPPEAAMRTARALLIATGALRRLGRDAPASDDGDEALESTPYARRIASLPTHPRLAHMLLSAKGHARLEEVSALLAALLAERDVFRGGASEHGVDVRKRVAALEQSAPPPEASGGAWSRTKREAKDLLGQVRRSGRRGEEDEDEAEEGAGGGVSALLAAAAAANGGALECGVLLALAYPDRVAQLQPGKSNTFALSNGRGAALPTNADPLSTSDYLVAATLDGGDKSSARVQLAAPLTLVVLRSALAAALVEAEETFLAPSDGSVRARYTSRLGSLVLASEPLPAPSAKEAAPLLLRALRERGVEATLLRPADEAGARARELVARVALLRALHGPAGGWPLWTEASLAEDAEIWLERALRRATGIKELQASDVAAMLRATLDAAQRATLDQQAPTAVTLPSGSSARLSYAPENELLLPATDADAAALPPRRPVLASKLQEWFGASDGPSVGGAPGDALSVQLQLLSPAGRPLALVAGSLAQFWAGAYAQVRIEAKARYPRHPWPEDPASAEPTRLTKRALENRPGGGAAAAKAEQGGDGGGKKAGKSKSGLPKTKGGKTINAFKKRR